MPLLILGAGAFFVAAVVLSWWHGGGDTPTSFAAGVAILGVLTAVVACLPPAVCAAGRDPVDVMRMP